MVNLLVGIVAVGVFVENAGMSMKAFFKNQRRRKNFLR